MIYNTSINKVFKRADINKNIKELNKRLNNALSSN